jgi:prepilin-type N-terminal cleavage/methylation domain-containing protein
MNKKQSKWTSGFTIVELMIATTIVSIILVTVTTVMIGIQRLYYKGVNQEQVQNNVRAVTDQVTQEIQFSGGTSVIPASQSFGSYTVKANCIGSVRYLYIIGLEVGTDIKHALWRDTTPQTGCNPPAIGLPDIGSITNLNDGGFEYIPSGSRLTDFEINANINDSTSYDIYVSIAVGTIDQLNLNPGANNDYNATCKGITGDQYCATARLQTEVQQRLQ